MPQWWSCAALTPPYLLRNSARLNAHRRDDRHDACASESRLFVARASPSARPGIAACGCVGRISRRRHDAFQWLAASKKVHDASLMHPTRSDVHNILEQTCRRRRELRTLKFDCGSLHAWSSAQQCDVGKTPRAASRALPTKKILSADDKLQAVRQGCTR